MHACPKRNMTQLAENQGSAAWNSPSHLEAFSDWFEDLRIYRELRSRQIYQNLGRCLSEVVDQAEVINELGVGGGRSYQFFTNLLNGRRKGRAKNGNYKGYNIAQQCVDLCNSTFGPRFELVDESSEFRKCDLFFFFDVLVHSEDPLALLDKVSLSTTKFLCFQTPTRDAGVTEYNPEKSCRLENGTWVPWIVFNLDELLDELRERGFERFLVLKACKDFSGGGKRFLPKEFFEPAVGSARTAICAIKKDVSYGLEGYERRVHIEKTTGQVKIPTTITLMNKIWRKTRQRSVAVIA